MEDDDGRKGKGKEQKQHKFENIFDSVTAQSVDELWRPRSQALLSTMGTRVELEFSPSVLVILWQAHEPLRAIFFLGIST